MSVMEWETRPGQSWATSPPVEIDGGFGVVVGAPGTPAADWVHCPSGIPGYEHLGGRKLAIEAPFTLTRGEYGCPMCDDDGEKRGLAFGDCPLVVVECRACNQFLWLAGT